MHRSISLAVLLRPPAPFTTHCLGEILISSYFLYSITGRFWNERQQMSGEGRCRVSGEQWCNDHPKSVKFKVSKNMYNKLIVFHKNAFQKTYLHNQKNAWIEEIGLTHFPYFFMHELLPQHLYMTAISGELGTLTINRCQYKDLSRGSVRKRAVCSKKKNTLYGVWTTPWLMGSFPREVHGPHLTHDMHHTRTLHAPHPQQLFIVHIDYLSPPIPFYRPVSINSKGIHNTIKHEY